MKMTDIDRRTKLMKVIREVWQEEDGIGVVEIILILVILIMIIAIFR